ncbi:eukaryotic translation initiation factor 4 gamma 2 [Bicyclus anynana]|uniref:Eukaryotic translation initiation factor 4 gamma 2 n=1 Tax=Bicyclus anynana TaxID=110368 RepID=A0ABM3LG05_BICAN|nr:eukaryotic translation initiation factor 4 gamma 2 [Bicyclus anynana]
MYAQLCKRLSEEAPNFEPPGQPCTFKLLLLNKCRAEFENRAQAFAAFDERPLAPEDEERRHLAKCKMLGNIKFIGELGKLEILAESILHRCIQNLLLRRGAEQHEDLECLAQLVRTVGRVLDSDRGRGLMDQYFRRIETLAAARELAPRLRFMLRDVVELRRAGWVPRAAAAAAGEGPVPMHQLRADDEPRRERERERDPFRGLRARPLDDVLAGLALAQPPAHDKLFGNGLAPRDFRQRSAPGHFPRHKPAPPAKEPRKARAPPAGAPHDAQLRPPSNALLFTANRLSRAAPPPAALPAFAAKQPPKEPAVAVKPAPARDKPKKDKGLDKEEACRLALEALAALAARPAPAPAPDADEPPDEPEEPEEEEPALRRLRALQLPDKLLRRVVGAVLERALAAPADGEAAADALCAAAARVVAGVRRAPLGDTLRALVAARHPHARLPALLAHAVLRSVLSLAELGAWCEGGQHAPLLLETLQALRRAAGGARLAALVARSKLNVCAHVAEREAGAAAALEALEARGLGALAPQLRVRAALARQLAAEPAPGALYRWIRGNVDAAVRRDAAFVTAAVALLAEHVSAAAGALGGGGGDKAALEREKALAEEYAPLLTALLEGRAELQLAAVYAAQLHAHRHRYPKGMLLRWFMYLYNLEVCEEEAFLRWREDVTDAYPGKGEALFQVNTWLTWLQQQESEDEEAED